MPCQRFVLYEHGLVLLFFCCVSDEQHNPVGHVGVLLPAFQKQYTRSLVCKVVFVNILLGYVVSAVSLYCIKRMLLDGHVLPVIKGWAVDMAVDMLKPGS